MKIAIAVQHMLDIRGATRRSECDCPVARAINRRFGLNRDYFGSRGVRVNSGEGWLRWPVARFNVLSDQVTVELPAEVAEFISRYDSNKHAHPFTFVIDVPEALWLLAPPLPALTAGAG